MLPQSTALLLPYAPPCRSKALVPELPLPKESRAHTEEDKRSKRGRFQGEEVPGYKGRGRLLAQEEEGGAKHACPGMQSWVWLPCTHSANTSHSATLPGQVRMPMQRTRAHIHTPIHTHDTPNLSHLVPHKYLAGPHRRSLLMQLFPWHPQSSPSLSSPVPACAASIAATRPTPPRPRGAAPNPDPGPPPHRRFSFLLFFASSSSHCRLFFSLRPCSSNSLSGRSLLECFFPFSPVSMTRGDSRSPSRRALFSRFSFGSFPATRSFSRSFVVFGCRFSRSFAFCRSLSLPLSFAVMILFQLTHCNPHILWLSCSAWAQSNTKHQKEVGVTGRNLPSPLK